jgi:hypothetical protein
MESILGFHHLDTDLNTERYLVVEALRIKERQDETQFTTKTQGSGAVFVLSYFTGNSTVWKE